jgi:hypothetical protein
VKISAGQQERTQHATRTGRLRRQAEKRRGRRQEEKVVKQEVEEDKERSTTTKVQRKQYNTYIIHPSIHQSIHHEYSNLDAFGSHCGVGLCGTGV